MTSGSFVSAPATFTSRVFPVTVMQPGCIRSGSWNSALRIAGIPPARSTSSMWYCEDGDTLQSVGVLCEMASIRARSSGTPASWAIASVWRIVFVDPPMAMSSVSALSNASSVTMSRGFRSIRTSSISRKDASR